jgi:hypothetical protein
MDAKIEPHIKAYCGHTICKNWKNCTICDVCNCDCIMAKCSHGKNDKCKQLFILLPCNHYIIEHCDCEIILTEFLAYELQSYNS